MPLLRPRTFHPRRCQSCRLPYVPSSGSQVLCPECSLTATITPTGTQRKRSKAHTFKLGPLPRAGSYSALRVVLAQYDRLEVAQCAATN